jgi:hypothetical protein
MEFFKQGKEIIELAGLFMVVLPMLGMGVLALQSYYQAKGKK